MRKYSPSIVCLSFLMIGLLGLSGCGFTPLYAKHQGNEKSSLATIQSNVAIGNIPEREGQVLRNALVDHLYIYGTPANPVYRLDIVDLREKIRDLDVTIRSDTTREQIRMRARMVLIEIGTGQPVFEKAIGATGSYNVLESEYTTRISRQSVRDDLLAKMALQAERYLSLYFAGL